MIPRAIPAAPSASGGPARWPGEAALTGGRAAVVVLALFWVLMVAALWDKSLTYDEVAHAAAGYSYWHYGDYRLQPENGQLPQRVAGLPMALALAPLPAPDAAAWGDAEQWLVGGQWIYGAGRDAAALGREGRLACGLFAVALGALVWAWSRRLFGARGAMLSLLLFVLSPTVLANGALMTSDMAAALFFAATLGAFWAALHRPSLLRVLGSAALMAALFLSKASALLILPLGGVLLVARVADGRPLPVLGRLVISRGRQAAVLAAVVAVHAVVVGALLWGSYGFRYSAFAGEGRFRLPWQSLLAQPAPLRSLRALVLDDAQKARIGALLGEHGVAGDRWTNASVDALAAIRRDVLTADQVRQLDGILQAPSATLWVRAVGAMRDHHVLPEAWLYGLADVLRRSEVRPAFLNGDFRLRGWPTFFPYTFLVKTPAAVFGLLALALAAVRWRGAGLRASWAAVYPTLPLWLFLVAYAAAALASHLNIGHRHLLPLYAPLFVLCGVLARWLDRPARRAGAVAIGALLAALALEVAWTFPDYLAYFNGLVPLRSAYRHLVDSSLDWGQDLPAVRSYLERHPVEGGAAYLSYFGAASPAYYGINAHLLYSVGSIDALAKPDWKTVMLPADDLAARLPALREASPEYDLLGLQRVDPSVIAVLVKKPAELRLAPGTYFISASMLQPVNFNLGGPWGPWNARYEATYQQLRAAVAPLAAGNEARRSALMQRPSGQWPALLEQFEEYRLGRLTAYLRTREPDEELHYSILVYHLSAAELARALEGPPPDYGPDDLAEQERELPPAGE